MSAISENIPKHLLKTVEEDNSTQTILTENNSKKTTSKKKKEEKPCCQAAAKHNTIKDALVAMTDKKMDVFVIREANEDDLSKIKETAYSKCTISAVSGKQFCHHHIDCKNLKVFENDILPRGDDDLERRQLTAADDEYFKGMGKRGARAKKTKNVYEFKDPNSPIKLVLENKNGFLQIELNKFAFELLKNEKYKNAPPTQHIEKKTRGRPLKDANVASAASVQTTNTVIESNKTENDVDFGSDDEDEIEEVEQNEEAEDENEDEVEEDENVVENEDNEVEESEDDEIELTTLCNKKITYIPSENDVYDPEDIDDEGAATWIGNFHEMDEKYANINYNGKAYGILSKKSCKIDNKPFEFYNCVLNNNAFGMDKKYIGKYVEKNGSYEIEFAKKKTSSSKKA